eukprot:GFKZ01012165.1.p1 GENE.GFKZ01012165.1~~GFKZ01012165.1.p1  ORF type:complete len:110 (+),score=15.23 GFKZ01012165.1:188-517(+)
MRDMLLSATAGFLATSAAAFAVHRRMWKTADQHAKQLDELAGHTPPAGASVPKRNLRDSFEGFILHRFGRWWNRGVDNVHGRLVGLPDTVDRIVEDVKSTSSDAANTNE